MHRGERGVHADACHWRRHGDAACCEAATVCPHQPLQPTTPIPCCCCCCRRRDVYERAELSRGTYEIVATKEYMVRAPQPVIHVFCIDVSQPAIASGATAATCQCIEQVLDSLQGECPPRAAVRGADCCCSCSANSGARPTGEAGRQQIEAVDLATSLLSPDWCQLHACGGGLPERTLPLRTGAAATGASL